MNEEELSELLFREASEDAALQVLSWQSVDGKGYFTADVKLRLSTGERMEPDLIVATGDKVWLVEVKSLHGQAIADEQKLARLEGDMEAAALLGQIRLRSQVDVGELELATAVAYVKDDVADSSQCLAAVAHISWEDAIRERRTLLEQLR